MGELTKKELYLEEYKILGNVLLQDEALFWRRSEVFIVINGGLLTILGLLHPKEISPNAAINLAPALMCFVATLLCILWFFILKRSEALYNHWYEHLKYLENTQLQPMDLYNIADEFFTNGKVKLGDRIFKLDPISRGMHISQALQLASLIFAVIWIGMAVYSILT